VLRRITETLKSRNERWPASMRKRQAARSLRQAPLATLPPGRAQIDSRTMDLNHIEHALTRRYDAGAIRKTRSSDAARIRTYQSPAWMERLLANK
jgi:hypothetical protein